MHSPKNLSASPKILEKTKFLDLILTLTFFLFVLAFNFSISITQIAGFTGLAILLIRTQLTKSWNKLNRIFLWPFLGLFLAGALSTALSSNPSYSLPIFKKLALFVIFFWVVNGIQHINLRQFQPFLARFLKSRKQSSSIASYFNRPGSISPYP